MFGSLLKIWKKFTGSLKMTKIVIARQLIRRLKVVISVVMSQ
jgi:hypothetical protein